ncbi:hypothetical protein BC834DRAFT_970418 [Gloeopeniophorella convolvens]|nr:hypothetical protein BC834DRAFT_970418 [Gloeopeniophorella convolvens]
MSAARFNLRRAPRALRRTRSDSPRSASATPPAFPAPLSMSKGNGAGLVPILAEDPLIPDDSFLLRPRPSYLSYQHRVVFGLDEVARLVTVLTDEPVTRGLTTPFLFSLTVDVKSSGVRRLFQAFLRTWMPFVAPDADRTWREEARFAAPPELATCLRWGSARSEAEVAHNYPATHFETLVAPLPSTIINVLSLLARLLARSPSSGHTPPTLLPLFGPLLFGLGPATLVFYHTCALPPGNQRDGAHPRIDALAGRPWQQVIWFI